MAESIMKRLNPFVTGTMDLTLNGNGNASLNLDNTKYILVCVMCTNKTDCVCIPYRYGTTTIGIHCINDGTNNKYPSTSISVFYVAYRYA